MFPHIGLGFLQVLSWNIDWSQRVSYFTQSSSLNCAVLGDSSLNLDLHYTFNVEQKDKVKEGSFHL